MNRGRPIRGIFAGLFLGICLDLVLVFSGAVKLDAAILTILPIALTVLGFLLGLWAPIGRGSVKRARQASPLPTPVAWPESAATEGSTASGVPAGDAVPPPPPPPI
jgi:hypothetical protein